MTFKEKNEILVATQLETTPDRPGRRSDTTKGRRG